MTLGCSLRCLLCVSSFSSSPVRGIRGCWLLHHAPFPHGRSNRTHGVGESESPESPTSVPRCMGPRGPRCWLFSVPLFSAEDELDRDLHVGLKQGDLPDRHDPPWKKEHRPVYPARLRIEIHSHIHPLCSTLDTAAKPELRTRNPTNPDQEGGVQSSPAEVILCRLQDIFSGTSDDSQGKRATHDKIKTNIINYLSTSAEVCTVFSHQIQSHSRARTHFSSRSSRRSDPPVYERNHDGPPSGSQAFQSVNKTTDSQGFVE